MKKFLINLLLFLPFVAFAHPGHGHPQEGFLHYLTTPFHLAVMGGILAAGLIGGAVWYRHQQKKTRENA